MISNEQPSPYARPSGAKPDKPHYEDVKPSGVENVLGKKTVKIESKTFTLMLKGNPRGKFLRIGEEKDGQFYSIVIPASGLMELCKAIAELAEAGKKRPDANDGQNPSSGGPIASHND